MTEGANSEEPRARALDEQAGAPPNGHVSPTRRARVRGFIGGFRLLFEGLGMLVRKPTLWPLAAVPVTFSVVAVVSTGALVFGNTDVVIEFVTGWMPELEVGAWYTWLWLGPAKFFFSLLGHILFAAVAGIALLLAFLVANLLSSPFLDALSQRVERLEAGAAFGDDMGGIAAILGDARRTVVNEFQRLFFFVGVWVVISLGGILIPGGQVVAPFLLIGFTAIFLPLDYSGYSLDRQHVSFRRRRAWVRENLGVMVGFGGAALGTTIIPGLNFLLLPTLVVAGTLLALRCPPEPDSRR